MKDFLTDVSTKELVEELKRRKNNNSRTVPRCRRQGKRSCHCACGYRLTDSFVPVNSLNVSVEVFAMRRCSHQVLIHGKRYIVIGI